MDITSFLYQLIEKISSMRIGETWLFPVATYYLGNRWQSFAKYKKRKLRTQCIDIRLFGTTNDIIDHNGHDTFYVYENY